MSIYESMINPRLAEQLRLSKRAQVDEMIQLYEAHARHVQSYDFQCTSECAISMRNVHEYLCLNSIVGWPDVPNVRICQRHRRLFFDAGNNAQKRLAQMYIDAFPPDETAEVAVSCEADCPLLSVPHILYRAKAWQMPWLPIFACLVHSTLHACTGAGGVAMLCGYRGDRCGACRVGRLCYERCPINANSVDRHAGHVCLFSNVLVAYMTDAAFAKWDAHTASESESRRQRKRRTAASDSAVVLARDAAVQQWITHATAMGRRHRAASADDALVSRAEAEGRIAEHFISTWRLEGTTFVLEPRDVWQFVPMLYASFNRPQLPCVPDNTMEEHAAGGALLFLFDRIFMHRLPVMAMLKRVAANELGAAFRATDLMRNYATLLMHFVPPSGVPSVALPARFSDDEAGAAAAWIADARTERERAAAVAAAAAATDALPIRLRTEAIRNYPSFFMS